MGQPDPSCSSRYKSHPRLPPNSIAVLQSLLSPNHRLICAPSLPPIRLRPRRRTAPPPVPTCCCCGGDLSGCAADSLSVGTISQAFVWGGGGGWGGSICCVRVGRGCDDAVNFKSSSRDRVQFRAGAAAGLR